MEKKIYKGLIVSILVIISLFTVIKKESIAEQKKEKAQIKLKMGAFMPPFAPQVKVYNEWAAKIAEGTNGLIKITIFPGGTLLAQDDVVSGIAAGTADMADFTLSSRNDQFPFTPILNLPFLPLGDAESGYKIWMDLQSKFPEMREEFKDFKIVIRATTASYALHTAKKPVKLPTDLRGMKIFIGGMGDIMNNLNAAPMMLPVTDWYMSLERGLLEGMWMNWQAIYEMKCYEFLTYHTVFPSGCTLGMSQVMMNLDSWNNLPPDAQKLFDELSPWATERIRQKAEIEAAINAKNVMKEAGHTFIVLTPDEENEWRKIADPIIEAHLTMLESKGLPARAAYKDALELAKKYKP